MPAIIAIATNYSESCETIRTARGGNTPIGSTLTAVVAAKVLGINPTSDPTCDCSNFPVLKFPSSELNLTHIERHGTDILLVEWCPWNPTFLDMFWAIASNSCR